MRDTKSEILSFWFEETQPKQWFQVNEDFDQEIRDRFLVSYDMAQQGMCDGWQRDSDGCLALCILLDQFPRNMFRGEARAFATDHQALLVAEYALKHNLDQVLSPIKRRFIYLPYEHSENLDHQKLSVDLFAGIRDDDPLGYDYAVRHKEVIEKFGRFPHRNKALGRSSTKEEIEYLEQGGGF